MFKNCALALYNSSWIISYAGGYKLRVICIKIVFIYHVLYGSLLVRCCRVVNKGAVCFIAIPAVRTHCTHLSRPVFVIRCPVFDIHLHTSKNL